MSGLNARQRKFDTYYDQCCCYWYSYHRHLYLRHLYRRRHRHHPIIIIIVLTTTIIIFSIIIISSIICISHSSLLPIFFFRPLYHRFYSTSCQQKVQTTVRHTWKELVIFDFCEQKYYAIPNRVHTEVNCERVAASFPVTELYNKLQKGKGLFGMQIIEENREL